MNNPSLRYAARFFKTALFVGVALLSILLPQTVSAQAALTIEPITWDVIGLDSNNVNAGPQDFMVGVRVCNTGTADATNVVTNFVWDSANTYINLAPGSPSTLTLSVLAAGDCSDFYYNVTVTRDANAYNTAREYHITATADGLGTISTPIPRQLYVEKLVSQNRNDVLSITGPTTVYVGQTVTYTVSSSTATNGYEQLVSFLNFSNIMFRLVAVDTTYSAPPGATNDGIYADACGWDSDPTSPNYRSCTGTGKAGGDILTTYTVEIIGPGTSTLTTLIYDFSGSSYHYNSDLSHSPDNIIVVTALEPPDLSIAKTDNNDPVFQGDTVIYTITVTNNHPTTAATNVTVSDTFSGANVTIISVTSSQGGCTAFPCNLGTIPGGGSATITVTVTANQVGTITNTVSVRSTEPDGNTNNNNDTETTTVNTPPTPTPTPTNTDTPTNTATPTATNTPTSTATSTPTSTATDTPTNTNTPLDTPTNTATNTNTPVDTPTPTDTKPGAPTDTPTSTDTPTDTPTPTDTQPGAPTDTPTSTDTPTDTPTPTDTQPGALTNTPTDTPTSTGSQQNTPTPTDTPTGQASPGNPPQSAVAPTLAFVDPFITKSVSPPFALPGEQATWSIIVTNPGSIPATNILVMDDLPAEVEILSVSSPTGTATFSGQHVTFTLPVLNPGQTVTITVVTRVRADVPVPFNIRNLASLTNAENPTPRYSNASILSVGRLPQTGESPWSAWRLPLLALFGAALLALARRFRIRLNTPQK